MSKKNVELKVEGMSCSHCENAVKKSVGALAGIDSVIVDLQGKKVTVEFDNEKATTTNIKDAIEDQGYDVISVVE